MKKLYLIIFILCSFKSFSLELKCKIFPENFKLEVDDNEVTPTKIDGTYQLFSIPPGEYNLTIKKRGYKSKNIKINLKNDYLLEEKLERIDSRLRKIYEFKVGVEPKSVRFSSDSRYLATPLLEDNKIDIRYIRSLDKEYQLQVPNEYFKKGFVESTFLNKDNEIWVSQMTTSTIHIFDSNTLKYKETIKTNANWSKVIKINKDESEAYVTNWVTKDISIIDVVTKKVTGSVKTSGIPRGVEISPNGNLLYVCIFDTGNIDVVDIKQQKLIKTIRLGLGAKRHIVYSPIKKVFYISDMSKGTITVLDANTGELLKVSKRIGYNLNTIDLTSDNKYLFVSERGINNKNSYYLKGPKFGKILVLDTKTLEVIDWVWGRNQPTGLDISPDDRYLAFTNFLDNSVELYDISGLWKRQ